MTIDETSLKISQLNRLTEVKQSDELFFSNKSINFTDNESNRISFKNIVSIITKDINSGCQFGSMITESDSDYSKRDHVHEYSYTTANSYYQLSDSNELTNLLGTIEISSDGQMKQTQIWITSTKYDTMDEKYIGEIRMINSSKLNSREQIIESMTKRKFDGWVYADGYTYDKKIGYYDFSEAYNKIKNDGNGKFTVPDLRNFFKCNSNILRDSIKEIEANTVLPIHAHNISSDEDLIECDIITDKINIDAKVQTYTSQSSNQPSTGTVLAATKSTKGTDNDTSKIDAKCSFSEWFYSKDMRKLTENHTQLDSREQYPTHMIVIPMIWIGTKEAK